MEKIVAWWGLRLWFAQSRISTFVLRNILTIAHASDAGESAVLGTSILTNKETGKAWSRTRIIVQHDDDYGSFPDVVGLDTGVEEGPKDAAEMAEEEAENA